MFGIISTGFTTVNATPIFGRGIFPSSVDGKSNHLLGSIYNEWNLIGSSTKKLTTPYFILVIK
jgi:hypothetical protein